MSLIYSAPSAAQSGKKAHGLYIGGKADAKSRKRLDEMGVTHILNVTPEKDASIQSGVPNYFEKDARLTYKRIPVYDASTSDLLSQADPIVGFISSGLHHGSVLVHCKMGASRSATCVIFFLMRKLGMTFDNAFALCCRRRPDVNPIPAFVTQLRKYEMKCRKLGVISDSVAAQSPSKKRKSPAGPSQGAVIGPSRPMQGPSIGPSLPPGDKAPKDSHDEHIQKKAKAGGCGKEEAIGPSIGPSSRPRIGPAVKDNTIACADVNDEIPSSDGKGE